MVTQLRILYLEDQPIDAELTQALLEAEGFACEILRVETGGDFAAALEQDTWDLIFSDKSLPAFDGMSALAMARARCPEVPFIFVSGTLGEEVAIESLKMGATDYVLKQRLKRLVPVTRRALREAAERQQRQQAEDALRENEARFRLLFASNPLPMWVYDLTTLQFLEVNEAAVAHYGYSRAEFLQMTIPDIRPPAAVERLFTHLAQARPVLQHSGEWQHQLKSGQVIDVQITSHTLIDAQRAACLVVANDITERKQAAAALRENEQRLFQFLEAVPLGLTVFDATGQPYYSNQAARAILRQELDPNVPAAEVPQFYRAYLAGTNTIYPHERRPTTRALAGEVSSIDDMEIHHPDQVIPLQVWGAPIYDAAGHIAYAISAFADITARQQAEADLRLRAQQQATVAALGQRALAAPALDDLLDEAIQLAIAGLDADFSALAELTPDGQELVLRSVYGWPAERIGQRIAIDRTTQSGATLLANRPLILDEQHPQPDFDIVPGVFKRGAISAISVVVPGPDRPFGTLVVHSTRRRTFTEPDIQFLQSVANVLAAVVERERSIAAQAERDAAERANLAKSEFLSRMSHELRTPLHAILGFSQLLEMADLPTRQQESVAHIQTAGQHLLMLINEVLDISRIEAGRLALSTEAVLLRDVLDASLTLAGPSAADRQITIITPDLATTTPYIFADHQRLKQVLLNLLNNAIKYNRFGGRVEIAWDTRAGESLHLTVRDTGRGIVSDFLPRLFTPFERAAEQIGVEGTGLGLALSQRLMVAMGGSLVLESTSSAGSTFALDIPLATPPVTLPVPPATDTAVLAVTTGPQRTLLLIDDNLSNLRLVERILELRPGITILAAQEGQHGLELARAHRPDLIFLDLHLPDIGGDRVLRHLLDDPVTAPIPVVIFSADVTPGQISRLRAAGATDYLTKPFRIATFLALIDRLLLQGEQIRD